MIASNFHSGSSLSQISIETVKFIDYVFLQIYLLAANIIFQQLMIQI